MKNRLKAVEVTKAYCEAFNRRDLPSLADMLDGDDVVFSRQGQPTLVGRDPILHRTKKTFKRLKKHNHTLHMVRAIIDIKGTKARPCLLGILDGERFSVVILNCKMNGLITSMAILLGEKVLAAARPLDPIPQMEEEEVEEQHCKKAIQEEMEADENPQLLAIETKLTELARREKKILKKIKEKGRLPALVGKLLAVEGERDKLKLFAKQIKKKQKIW